MLARLQGGSPPDPATRKLWLTTRLLQLRIRHPRAFTDGSYEPVAAGETTVAFLRGDEVLVVVITRPGTPAGSLEGLAPGSWRDVLTGRLLTLGASVPVSELVGPLGVAVLERSQTF
jgi:maltooligosyltrehalose synthase